MLVAGDCVVATEHAPSPAAGVPGGHHPQHAAPLHPNHRTHPTAPDGHWQRTGGGADPRQVRFGGQRSASHRRPRADRERCVAESPWRGCSEMASVLLICFYLDVSDFSKVSICKVRIIEVLSEKF